MRQDPQVQEAMEEESFSQDGENVPTFVQEVNMLKG